MTADVKLTDEMLQGVISAAVLRAIDQKTRDALIAGALTHLLNGKSDHWKHKDVSPLEAKFREAVEAFCQERCREMVAANAELKAKIDALLAEAVARVFDNPERREKLVSQLADKVADGMFPSRY